MDRFRMEGAHWYWRRVSTEKELARGSEAGTNTPAAPEVNSARLYSAPLWPQLRRGGVSCSKKTIYSRAQPQDRNKLDATWTIKACGTHPRSAAHQRRQTPGHMSAVLPHPCNCNLPSVVCILLLPTPRLCHTAYPIRPSAEAAERR
jgi:hypothetical protein